MLLPYRQTKNASVTGVLNIRYASLEIKEYLPISEKEKTLTLSRNGSFITLKFAESGIYEEWHNLMKPYVVQRSIEDIYEFGKLLGKGAFGSVFQAAVISQLD